MKAIESMKWFEIEELTELREGIVILSVGAENLYFEYKNELGHFLKGYYKF